MSSTLSSRRQGCQSCDAHGYFRVLRVVVFLNGAWDYRRVFLCAGCKVQLLELLTADSRGRSRRAHRKTSDRPRQDALPTGEQTSVTRGTRRRLEDQLAGPDELADRRTLAAWGY